MSIGTLVRERVQQRQAAATSLYAKAVIDPQALKGAKDAERSESALAESGRSIEQLEGDIEAYRRAQEIEPELEKIPDAEKDLNAAIEALIDHEVTAAGELARQRAILKEFTLHGRRCSS